MVPRFRHFWLWMCLIVPGVGVAQAEVADTLKQGVPQSAYLAMHTQYNAERDFLRQYWTAVGQTVEETRIVPRAIESIAALLSEEDRQAAEAVINQIREALQPIKIQALLDAKELVYAQTMDYPTTQHLLLVRLTPQAAQSTTQGIGNVLRLLEKQSEGKVTVHTEEVGQAQLTRLAVPGEIPLAPAVAHLEDVVVLSTSADLVRESLQMLTASEARSKFDDPRLQAALQHLPQPEDQLVFYDGQQQFAELRKIGQWIRQTQPDDEDAERVAGLLETLIDQLAILDYEITVQYTEGNQIHSVVLGKLLPDVQDKALAQAFADAEPFTDWQRWVPAQASAFTLSTGMNLHPIYEKAIEIMQARFPEAQEGITKFEQMQQQFDLHLDRDLLQGFSGRYVSLRLPSREPARQGGEEFVLALECRKPDRIQELLNRLYQYVNEQPFLKSKQIQITEHEQLEGFKAVSIPLLQVFSMTPVIGFHDQWLVIGSNIDPVERVLATRNGQQPSIASTDLFSRFKLQVDGPVYRLAYVNLARQTRQIARVVAQVGTILPGIMGMAANEEDPQAQNLQTVRDLIGLLPSVARIINQFDFFEEQLSITQAAEEATYRRHAVTLVRQPQ